MEGMQPWPVTRFIFNNTRHTTTAPLLPSFECGAWSATREHENAGCLSVLFSPTFGFLVIKINLKKLCCCLTIVVFGVEACSKIIYAPKRNTLTSKNNGAYSRHKMIHTGYHTTVIAPLLGGGGGFSDAVVANFGPLKRSLSFELGGP